MSCENCPVCSAPAGDDCPAWCRFEAGDFDSRSSGPASCAGCDEELNDEAVEIGLILCPDCLTCQINIAFANPELAGVDE